MILILALISGNPFIFFFKIKKIATKREIAPETEISSA
jgi:hypothetical protein